MKLLAVIALIALAPRSAMACDPVSIPVIRTAAGSILLATASPRTATGGGVGASVTRIDPRPDWSSGRAILVPWEFGPDCRPIPWSGDRPWSPPAAPAVYSGVLRERSAWIDNVPTFDVHTAVREPLWPRPATTATEELTLTTEEFFELYIALPTGAELGAWGARALERLERWVAANPGLAARQPARAIVDGARRMAAGKD